MRPGLPAPPSPRNGQTLAPFSPLSTPMPPNRRCRRSHEPGEDSEERSRSSCREDKEHEAKPASAQTLLVASSSLPASQAEALPQVSQLLSSPPVSRIWERLLRDWGRRFYIRLDHRGYLHTYPDVGGPFQNFEQTYKAIDSYLETLRDPKMCVEKDKNIIQSLYWPDGTIIRCKTAAMTEKLEMHQFARAIVDKHNEDHGLLEDRAHELKDVLQYKGICEKLKPYYHLNFTTKIKGGGPNESSMDNLVFVEVECVKKGKLKEWLVRCFCTLDLSENGSCYGCTRDNGVVIMKHPSSSDRYIAGHLDVGSSFRHFEMWKRKYVYEYEDWDDDKYVKAREAELRKMFEVSPPITFIPPEDRPTIHKVYRRKKRDCKPGVKDKAP